MFDDLFDDIIKETEKKMAEAPQEPDSSCPPDCNCTDNSGGECFDTGQGAAWNTNQPSDIWSTKRP